MKEIKYFLPEFFYVAEVEDHQQIKDSLYPQIQKLKGDLKSPWTLCNAKSSYELDVRTEINDFLYEEKLFTDALWKAYDDLLTEPLIRNSYDFQYPKESTVNLWFNVYEKGSYQEIHNHIHPGDCYFSSVYLLHDESDTGLCFRSDNRDIVRYSSSTTMQPQLTEGHLVIFPAYFDHYVLPATGDRITITGNIQSS